MHCLGTPAQKSRNMLFIDQTLPVLSSSTID